MADNSSQSDTNAPRRASYGNPFVTLILVIVLLAVLLYALSAFTSLNVLGLNKDTTSGEWKAVFLTNGQVYFGRTVNENTNPVVLRNIYYLQATQPLQQVGQGQAPVNTNQPQLSLVKLGNELHGPQDEMRINREHVLFIESLKDGGRVVEAIDAYTVGQQDN